jgi:hypothetical protein
MEGIIGFIIQIVAGAIGGNAAGAGVKKYSLGAAGNSIAGAVGGLILGQVLAALGIGEPGTLTAEGAAPAAGGMDVGALVAQVVGGGAGGAILTLIGGAIKNMMGKSRTGT